MNKIFSYFGFLILLLILLYCVGCGNSQHEVFQSQKVRRVWPHPPEQARIEYLGMIVTEEDLTSKDSWPGNIFDLIFGKKEIGVLLSPYDIAINLDGTVYIADGAGGAIHIFDLKRHKYRQFSSIGKNRTLQRPVAVTLIEDNLYVVDSELNEVCVFDRAGKFKFSFGSELLTRPSGVAYSKTNGYVFVSDTGAHRLVVFDKAGKSIASLGSRGTGPGQFNFPTCLWVDVDGKLYVSDTLNYRVQIFSNQGSFIRMFGDHGDRPGYFAHPGGIATDSLGHIYVTDRQFENIQVFDQSGNILMAFGKEGNDVGEFWLPSGMYIDQLNRIYIADTFNKRVQVFKLLEVSANEQ